MRGTRWLLLVAIVAIVAGIVVTYRFQKQLIKAAAPERPPDLPSGLTSIGNNYCFTESTATYTKVEVCAGGFQEGTDSGKIDLEKVVLKLHNRNGKTFDLVTSAAATFFKNEHKMYSEGEVEITLDVPETGTAARPPVSIKSSGVTFDTGSGRVETERLASFKFASGAGQAVGAVYDTNNKQLSMKNAVELDWKSAKPNAKPMRMQAGGLEYREALSEIWLLRGAKLTRENTVVEGESATIRLAENAEGEKTIRKIDAAKAHGTDSYPHRKLDYAAEELWVNLDEEGEVQKIIAQTNARLQAVSDASETAVTAHHAEMNFETKDRESTLSTVQATGDAVVTSKPLAAPNRPPTETHVLRSATIDMKMRPGGKEIDNVSAPGDGVLEFLPNLPSQHHRVLTGKEMLIAYAAENRVRSFRSTGVRTETAPTADELKRTPKRPPSITTSRAMSADFDPKTGRLSSMEQSGDFTFDQGERKAHAARATLDAQDVMYLETGASISDASGATSAEKIRIDQKTGNLTAEGGVHSSRLSDKSQKKKSSEMLSSDDPLLAQAAKMETSNDNRKVHYEGNALMWQGANRIQAETIDLDRDKRMLVADGKVVTNLWEGPKDDPKKKGAAPVVTEVRAGRMVYTEQNRLALYSGGSELKRSGLQVTSRELRAWLSDSPGDSRLEKAFADGTVTIVHQLPAGTRTGSAGHAEFYSEDQKIVLREDRPRMVNPNGTEASGDELTYYANDARLLVDGSPAKPAVSRIKPTGKKK